MPRIYLSPSTQEYNPYVTGNGSEEYFMNLVADAMEPYLLANGIQFSRNTPDMTAASSIRQANRGDYDFYLALHSNASGPGSQGQNRGVIAFYYPTSANGRRGAEIIARNMQEIYPLPERVVTRPTTTLGEVRQPRTGGAGGDRVSRQRGRRPMDRKPHRRHRPEPGHEHGGILRSALYLSRSQPARRHRHGVRRAGEPAGGAVGHGPGADPDPQWGDGDGVRAVSGMVRGAVRRYPGVRQRAICANLDI